ncbi:uncharacterized protein Dwil_GK16433 [Drosophila willistoni]|uniref:BLOC-1-related complex subunit 6 C-terminal helix domain-containing protein n=1 Tax=Drosophila willistoni TaxID=7260 RepID=B4MXU1_DROWI|nr:BLOC-1-related complex subunit 6 [Drosophila willistoni]EDW76860.1 uncharacterized protein Dwil_GK16433 [Drosophila willistoni]
MSRRSQDIPIRPRYGYTEDEQAGEGVAQPPASSYTEIPFLAQYPGPVPEHVLQDITPTASRGPPHSQESYTNLDSGEEEEEESNSNSKDSSEDHAHAHKTRPKSQSSFPYEIEIEGDSDPGQMRHFVSHNLEAKLRESGMSSAPTDSEQTTPSGASLPPGNLTQRFLQCRNVPEIDGNVLSDIELEAQYLATSVDNLLENLGNLLHSISSITADNVEVHKNAVNKLTDALDANIKCQYQLLAKAEEITKSMKPTEQLGQRIREIKRLVDMLDSTM